MNTQYSTCETFEDVSVEGDIDTFFSVTEQLYHDAVQVLQERYNSRTHWLEQPLLDDIETELPTDYAEMFVSDYVVVPSFYTLSAAFDTDTNPEEWFEEYDTIGFEEDKRYLYIKYPFANDDELPYEWPDNQTTVGDRFTISLPVTKDIIKQSTSALIEVERTDDGYETTFHLNFLSHDATEDMTDKCLEALLSDRPSEEREAMLVADVGVDAILVALGIKEVGSIPSRYRQINTLQQFPVSAICWNTDANEECEPDNTDIHVNDKSVFIYNTDFVSEDEMKQRLSEVYQTDDVTSSDFGGLVGYPEHATEAFARRSENDIAPAHDNYIKQLFFILTEDETVDTKEIDYASYNEYVYDYNNLSVDAERGQRIKGALINFFREYNIEPENPDKFRYTKRFPDKSAFPETFEAFWQLPY